MTVDESHNDRTHTYVVLTKGTMVSHYRAIEKIGADVLIISLGYGIGGQMVTVAALSLALNLLLTGVFIVVVKRLLNATPPTVEAL